MHFGGSGYADLDNHIHSSSIIGSKLWIVAGSNNDHANDPNFFSSSGNHREWVSHCGMVVIVIMLMISFPFDSNLQF